jgi:hypothetical protein
MTAGHAPVDDRDRQTRQEAPMSAMFWCTFGVLMLSVVVGLVESMRLYERITGRPAGGGVDLDLDRLVRESW